ncbi:hypothetical protein GCM10028815_14910 [Mariniluteicoccus flavus]
MMLLVAMLALLGIIAYAAFLWNPAYWGDPLPWTLVMIAESVLIFHALMAMWTILSGT